MEQVAAHHGGDIHIQAYCMDALLQDNKAQFPQNPADFHAFPERRGWKVKDDFGLEPESAETCDLAEFLQAWLFFGLISTVVQVDSRPALEFDQLVRGRFLCTRNLHDAIKRWAKWEAGHQDGLRLRMIQITYILERARRVMQKNCAYVPPDEVWYSQDTGPLSMKDEVALVLMCLGETLSEATARIIKENKVGMTGWYDADEQDGWGPPRYIFKQMDKEEWCPFAMRLLKGQFRSNATMLVAAYYAYRNTDRMTKHHKSEGCTPERCEVRSKDRNNKYENKHLCKQNNCEAFGPASDQILKILRNGNEIPLIRFGNDRGDQIEFEVAAFEQGHLPEFVTISHVWSDGWGNEGVNKLNHCQLRFIQRQIKMATRDPFKYFWMDTLIVPVWTDSLNCANNMTNGTHSGFDMGEVKELKKKAIRQIFQVFDASKWTIVIDNGLFSMNPGLEETPAEAAMKILASVWTRRLWTLQEAYLSQEIFFTFQEGGRGTNSLLSLRKIQEDLDMKGKDHGSGLIRNVQRQLSHVILQDEAKERSADRKKDLTRNASIIVANVWRAARWRVGLDPIYHAERRISNPILQTTSKKDHEMLALATLLNLDYTNTTIEEAGLTGLDEGSEDVERIDKLVKDFWVKVHERYKGAIPSGMIFLPGEKVNIPGYAWAPRTWLSAHEANYTDPMDFWNTKTDLHPDKGLLVNYPGIILHTESSKIRGQILGTSYGSSTDGTDALSFPTDRTLKEWYSFERAERADTKKLGTPNVRKDSKLAIILSRHPKESPREIALLVEIYKENSVQDNDGGPHALEYYTKTIRRVYIWRHRVDPNDRKTKPSELSPAYEFCLGEMVGPKQRWWVDGMVVPKVSSLKTLTEAPPKATLSRKNSWFPKVPTKITKILSWQ